MHLTCANCNTSFLIEEKLLVPNGKKVKCSKCAHIWYQEYSKPAHNNHTKTQNSPEPPKTAKIVIRPGFATYHLPVIVANNTEIRKTQHKLVYLIAIFAILYCVLIYYINIQILKFKAFKENFNVSTIGNLQNLLEDKMLIKYRISNISNTKQTLPALKITLLNEQQNIVFSSSLDTQTVTLEPHNYIYLTCQFSSIEKQINSFMITFEYSV